MHFSSEALICDFAVFESLGLSRSFHPPGFTSSREQRHKILDSDQLVLLPPRSYWAESGVRGVANIDVSKYLRNVTLV